MANISIERTRFKPFGNGMKQEISHDVAFGVRAYAGTGHTVQDLHEPLSDRLLRLLVGSDGAGVQLSDPNLRAVLGNADLQDPRTGSTITRPLSSLVLFDKNGKVAWSAP
jgi:hypothetical protein